VIGAKRRVSISIRGSGVRSRSMWQRRPLGLTCWQ
jgi:hypothetical protein